MEKPEWGVLMAEEKPEWGEIQRKAGLVPYKAPTPEVLKKLAEQRESTISP